MLLGIPGADILGNILAGKGVIRTGMEYAELVRIFNSASSFD